VNGQREPGRAPGSSPEGRAAPAANPGGAVAVRTRGLTKRFGTFTAVDDLTLEVRAGEIFGFLGSNGAGKSTVIRMLCGLLAPTGGSAHVLGVDVAAHPERVKWQLGYMSQRFSLYEDLTVRENLRFFGGIYGLRGQPWRERAAWAIEMGQLAGMEDRLAGALPGGWKQRLALACAVLHRPQVLFLDEPTSGVDPISRRRFWEQIDVLAGTGVTVFVTTHALDEAEHCDRIALMHAGRLIALGSVSELRRIFQGRALLEVRCPDPLAALDALEEQSWVIEATVFGNRIHLLVGDAQEGSRLAQDLLQQLGSAPAGVQVIIPALEDVFLHLIEEQEAARLSGAGVAQAGTRGGPSASASAETRGADRVGGQPAP
jgi:ABC-2 type transport system ATP-binding protein